MTPRTASPALVLSCLAALLLSAPQAAFADSAFDCSKSVKVEGKEFDLSGIKNAWTLTDTMNIPPSTRKTTIEASLCSPIPHHSDLEEFDQCPSGTRVCMTTSNMKEGHAERITSVMPAAGEIGNGNLDPQLTLGTAEEGKPAPLQIELKGGYYNGRERKAIIVLQCDSDVKEPKAISHAYSFSTATLTASWSSSQFCAKGDSNSGGGGGSDGDKDDSSKPPPESDEPAKDAPSSSAGSGGWGFFSWLFFLIFSGFALYFAVGMWMRRTQYGSQGWDMVPHRDFWADLPYVLRDLVTSRRNTGGYAAI